MLISYIIYFNPIPKYELNSMGLKCSKKVHGIDSFPINFMEYGNKSFFLLPYIAIAKKNFQKRLNLPCFLFRSNLWAFEEAVIVEMQPLTMCSSQMANVLRGNTLVRVI